MTITPIILAAGDSTRMGGPKPLLPFDGIPALQLVLDACQGLLTPVVVLGKSADAITARIPLQSFIVNSELSRGQAYSVKLGIAAAPGSFFILPADYPLVTRDDVAAVVNALRPGRIVVPSFNNQRGHPVAFDVHFRDEILALRDDQSLRDVIHRNTDRIDYVNSQSPGILMDMDTPEDYARCLEAYRAGK